MSYSDPWIVCPKCDGLRSYRTPGMVKERACAACSVECPECEGVGCLRGEDGPDPCSVCAGTGFARKKVENQPA